MRGELTGEIHDLFSPFLAEITILTRPPSRVTHVSPGRVCRVHRMPRVRLGREHVLSDKIGSCSNFGIPILAGIGRSKFCSIVRARACSRRRVALKNEGTESREFRR